MYWAIDTVQASDTFFPLLHFLEKMSVAGRETAKKVYGTSKYEDSWISHGFTDNYLNLGK